MQLIPAESAPTAAGVRVGRDAAGDVEVRAVRVGPESAVRDFGALELCKPNERKGETRLRAGF